VQNGQTEPKRKLWVTRRRTKVRREVKFVRSIKHFNNVKFVSANFYLIQNLFCCMLYALCAF